MNTETCVAPGYSKRAGETGCPIRRRPEIARFVFEFNEPKSYAEVRTLWVLD